MAFSPSSLETLCFARDCKRMRISSYDRSGGNDDRAHVAPGETYTFAAMEGAGIITHIWITIANDAPSGSEPFNMRKIYLSFYWDGEENPSVQAPIGDFFGMGHGETRNFVSEPLQMSPKDGKALNCWFPMPFGKGAKLNVTNECNSPMVFYFYVDYEQYECIPDNALRFHALWNREVPTKGKTPLDASQKEELMKLVAPVADQIDLSKFSDSGLAHFAWEHLGNNTDGKENYTILDAVGRGHYVGCNINIHNLSTSDLADWPGEGDDMIFIDDEPWPPRLHGTGTEDYVNTAWCPQQEYNAPYHGVILGGENNWKGKITYYRYHVRDPINFEKSIRVTIEHGHANNRNDDWSTTAYWYQTEPHKDAPAILPVALRMPVDSGMLRWDSMQLVKP